VSTDTLRQEFEKAYGKLDRCGDRYLNERAQLRFNAFCLGYECSEQKHLAVVERLDRALRNCRMLAARRKGEGDWAHILRFCEDAGIRAEILREAQTTPSDVRAEVGQ